MGQTANRFAKCASLKRQQSQGHTRRLVYCFVIQRNENLPKTTRSQICEFNFYIEISHRTFVEIAEALMSLFGSGGVAFG